MCLKYDKQIFSTISPLVALTEAAGLRVCSGVAVGVCRVQNFCRAYGRGDYARLRRATHHAVRATGGYPLPVFG